MLLPVAVAVRRAAVAAADMCVTVLRRRTSPRATAFDDDCFLAEPVRYVLRRLRIIDTKKDLCDVGEQRLILPLREAFLKLARGFGR